MGIDEWIIEDVLKRDTKHVLIEYKESPDKPVYLVSKVTQWATSDKTLEFKGTKQVHLLMSQMTTI